MDEDLATAFQLCQAHRNLLIHDELILNGTGSIKTILHAAERLAVKWLGQRRSL